MSASLHRFTRSADEIENLPAIEIDFATPDDVSMYSESNFDSVPDLNHLFQDDFFDIVHHSTEIVTESINRHTPAAGRTFDYVPSLNGHAAIFEAIDNAPYVFIKQVQEFARYNDYRGTHYFFNISSMVKNLLPDRILTNDGTSAPAHWIDRTIVHRFLRKLQPSLVFNTPADYATYFELLDTMSFGDFRSELIPVILVGIELNPGPLSMQSLLNQVHFQTQNNLKYELGLTQFITECAHRAMSIEVFSFLLLSNQAFRAKCSYSSGLSKSTLVLIAYSLSNPNEEVTLCNVPAPRLVCVETNPGPASMHIARFLSNSFTQTNFKPQMQLPLTVGLDSDSLSLLEDLVHSIKGLSSDGKINVEHSVSSGVSQSFDKVSESILGLGRMPANMSRMIKGLIGTVLYLMLCYQVGRVSGILMMKLFARLYPDKCDPALVEVFDRSDDIEDGLSAQMGASDLSFAVCSYLYYSAIGESLESCKDGKIKSMVAGFSKVHKAKDGIAAFIEHVISFAQRIVDYAATTIGTPMVRLTDSGIPGLDAIQVEIAALILEFRNGASYNAETGQRLFDIEKRLNTINAKIPGSRDFASQKKTCFDLIMSIKPFISRMERNNIVGNGPRREPLGIMMGGPPGTGKSASTVPLLLAVMARVLPESRVKSFLHNHNDEIWNFIPENPFHDAYHGQFCTIIDEAGFIKDAPGMGDPGAMGAIRFINTANAPLHMAHLEDKGNSNFCSEIVSATTNRNFFKWHSMYDSEAYVRRFKISVVVVPAKEFCLPGTTEGGIWERRLDLSKVDVAHGYDLRIAEFHPWNFLDGTPKPGEYWSFTEFVDYVVASFEFNKNKGQAMLDFHSQIKMQYAASRLKPQGGQDVVDNLVQEYGLCKTYLISLIEKAKLSFTDSNFKEKFINLINADFMTTAEGVWDVAAKFCREHATMIAAVTGAMTIVYLGWKFLEGRFFSQSGDVRKAKVATRSKKPRSSRTVVRGLQQQAGVDRNVVNMVKKVCKRNMYKISCEYFVNHLGYGIFIKGRVMILPEHFLYAIEDKIDSLVGEKDPVLTFERLGSPSVGFKCRFSDIEFRTCENSENDTAFAVFPDVTHQHSDISSFFLNPKEKPGKFQSLLVLPTDNDLLLHSTIAVAAGAVSYASYSTTNAFKYPIATQYGDCGSPLFVIDPSVGQPRIVGLHVAGNGSLGMSTEINPDHILDVLSAQTDTIVVHLDDADDFDSQMSANFLVGPKVRDMPLPSSNMVIPSALHGKFKESEYAPSMLRPLDLGDGLKDPWVSARSKYSRMQPCVDMALLDIVATTVSNTILFASDKDKPWDARKYTFEEAVAGIAGVPFCDGIPRNTSSGYPFSLDVKDKGKKDWFGKDGEYDFSGTKCAELRKTIEAEIKSLSNGIRMKVLYADYLKDERRKKVKVIAGATRLISASPLDYLIICRMYFGDFVRSCMSGRVTNEMAIGLNPYSEEWGYLVKHLTAVGDKNIFGDYSAYDGSLPISFMYKFLDIVEEFYQTNPDYDFVDAVVRRALFEDVVNSHHVAKVGPDCFEYEWYGSNPSGNFLTTVLNSTCNLMIIRYCSAKIIYESKPGSSYLGVVSSIQDHIRAATFGDDNAINISDEWSVYIDQQSLTAEMAKIGLKYTDESKSEGFVPKHRKITEGSFLKRAFVWDSNYKRWDAPLQFDVIEEMINWTKKGADKNSLITTVNTAVKEASLHGHSKFREFTDQLKPLCLKELSHSINTNYKANLREVRGSEGYY